VNSVAASRVTTAYPRKTGLCGTSPPRRLSSHATSSSAVTSSAPAPAAAILARMRASFSAAASPAHSAGWMRTGAEGGSGRGDSPLAPQERSTGLLEGGWRGGAAGEGGAFPAGDGDGGADGGASSGTSAHPAASSARRSFLAPSTVCSAGSIPTRAPLGRLAASHSGGSATPASPDRMSVHSSRLSCFSACRKYRPSVQRRAPCARVTTAVPAEPVKRVSHSRRPSEGAGYSL